jgi:hypothetical protein
MPEKGDRTLLALFLVVGTNIVGYFLLLTENDIAQLMLAAIVPGLTLTLVYLALAPRLEPMDMRETLALEKTIAKPSS